MKNGPLSVEPRTTGHFHTTRRVLGAENLLRHLFEPSLAMVNVHPKFRVIVAQGPNAIRELQLDIEDLLKRTGNSDEFTRTPAYFLGTIRKGKEKPFVVAVYDRTTLVGVAYCLKRCLFGIPMGIVESGDWDGQRSMLATAARADEVVDIVTRTIFRDKFTWLAQLGWISFTPSVQERALEQERSGKMMARALSFDVWNDLWLGSDYEEFLASLGSQTRRNMRYYRRRAEAAGWIFESNVTFEAAMAAVDSIYPRQEVGKTREEITVFQQQLAEIPGTFFSGIRNNKGEWISIIGGWEKGSNLFVILQLNDASYAKESVSVVLRGYVIEKAIEAGVRRMKFIGGCVGLLKKYCRLRVSHLLIQRKSYPSQLFGLIFRRLYPSSKIGCLFSDSQLDESAE